MWRCATTIKLGPPLSCSVSHRISSERGRRVEVEDVKRSKSMGSHKKMRHHFRMTARLIFLGRGSLFLYFFFL